VNVNCLIPYFGSARIIAPHVGKALEGCNWIGVGMVGGFAEVACMRARTLVINDLHRWVINLARVAADRQAGPMLYRRLRRVLFHPESLAASQQWCKAKGELSAGEFDVEAAYHYFVAVWMGHSARAGTDAEFNGGLSLRWSATGGDSAVRFRSAAAGLLEWRKILAGATFSTLDIFDWLDMCKDNAGHGIYIDPPWFGPGDAYVHKFTLQQHRQLADRVATFHAARVVMRFYDVPLIR
jgi:hypothetical protein